MGGWGSKVLNFCLGNFFWGGSLPLGRKLFYSTHRNSQDPEGQEGDPKVVGRLLQVGQVPAVANMSLMNNKEQIIVWWSLLLSSSDQYDDNVSDNYKGYQYHNKFNNKDKSVYSIDTAGIFQRLIHWTMKNYTSAINQYNEHWTMTLTINRTLNIEN